MKKWSVKEITVYGVLTALVLLATMLVQIPLPASKGYFNFGDAVLLCTALLLGKRAGFMVGGIGSMLADLLTGYAHYALITLVVKGIEGWLCGYLFEKTGGKHPLLVSSVCGLWMATGYLVGTIPLFGLLVAAGSWPPIALQGLVGAAVGTMAYKALARFELPIYHKKAPR